MRTLVWKISPRQTPLRKIPLQRILPRRTHLPTFFYIILYKIVLILNFFLNWCIEGRNFLDSNFKFISFLRRFWNVGWNLLSSSLNISTGYQTDDCFCSFSDIQNHKMRLGIPIVCWYFAILGGQLLFWKHLCHYIALKYYWGCTECWWTCAHLSLIFVKVQ